MTEKTRQTYYVSDEDHREAKAHAARLGMKLYDYVTQAIQEKNAKERMNNVRTDEGINTQTPAV